MVGIVRRMNEPSNFVKNFPEVKAKLDALTKAGPQWGEFSFDTGVLGDMLHGELTETWHLLPSKSRDIMLIVLAELYMHSDAEADSDKKAAEIVKRLRGGL